MDNQILTGIVSVLGVGATAITPFAIKTLLAIEKKAIQEIGTSNFESAGKFALKAVKAINQAYPDLVNVDKFAKAVDSIDNKYGKDMFTEAQIKVLIESAVSDVKAASISATSQVAAEINKLPVVETPAKVEAVEKVLVPIIKFFNPLDGTELVIKTNIASTIESPDATTPSIEKAVIEEATVAV